MMNDGRNGTQYSCVTVLSTVSNPTVADTVSWSNETILYVAGKYQCNFMYILNFILLYMYIYTLVRILRH